MTSRWERDCTLGMDEDGYYDGHDTFDYDYNDEFHDYPQIDYEFMPHITYGYHLTEHVWKRLLVRNMIGSSSHSQAVTAEMLGPELHTQFAGLVKPHDGSSEDKTSLSIRKGNVVAFTSSGRVEAARMVSRITQRPLYHFRLLAYNSQDLRSTLQRLERLATRWKCIAYFDDVLPTLRNESSLEAAKILSLFIDFLDSFQGPIVLSLGHSKEGYHNLDPDIGSRIDRHFHVSYSTLTGRLCL